MLRKILFFFLVLLIANYSYAASNAELERKVEAQSNLLINNQETINDLQSEMNSLRGQMEEIAHTLEQTVERQKTIIQQLAGKATSQTSSKEPQDISNWVPTGNDKTDYNFILKFISANKQTNETIDSLLRFLQNYPKSNYRANVNYWLGQLYYKQNKKNEASFYYATVVKSYPSSQKAAESLYKIGVILLEKGEKAKAKAVFEQVANKYPKDTTVIALTDKKLEDLE